MSASEGITAESANIFSSFYSFSLGSDGKDVIFGNYAGAAASLGNWAEEVGVDLRPNFIRATRLYDRVRGRLPQDVADRGEMQLILIMGMEDPEKIAQAESQFISEQALAAMNAQHNIQGKKRDTLNKRNQDRRANSRQAPSAGYAEAENRVWVGGFGAWNSQKNRDNVFGYDYNAGGVMLGYERELQNGLTLGLNGSWSSGKLKSNNGLDETDIKTFGLGLYASYEFGGGFFLDGSLGYGYADNEADFNLIIGGRKKSDFTSNSFTAGLNFGYSAQLGAATYLTPSLGLQYTHIKQNGWQEKIVSDPHNAVVANWFGDSKQNFLEIPLNLKLETTIETNGGIQVSPELRVGGIIAASKPKSELRMGFVGSSDSMTIHGIDPGQSRFTAGAGLKVQLNDTVDVFAGYDLEAKSGYKGHQATAGLGFSF